MPISTITQTISTIPEAGRRGVDVQTQFVIKQEDFQDHLQGTTVTELNTLKTQMNIIAEEMNTTASQVNTNANTASTKASEASASATSASTSANTATTKASQASASANTATTKASEASTSASTATTQAGIATTKASEASTSASSATTSANTATTKASEASASANTATTKASSATTSANTATTKASEASASANTATTKASEASASASNANVSSLKASQWADNNYNVEVETGKYSAKHWSTVAQNATVYKLDKDFSILTDKTTPDDTDILAIRETGGVLKKLSWANIKATLKTYFDSLYMKVTGDQTISGNKNFNNKVLISSSDGILGYASGTGTGAIVTQGSSSGKSTPIVLDKPSGSVIMNNAALASQSSIYLPINNNKILSTDGVVITQNDSGLYNAVNYDIWVVYKQDGLLGIVVKNISASTLSDAVRFRFDLIRGANS